MGLRVQNWLAGCAALALLITVDTSSASPCDMPFFVESGISVRGNTLPTKESRACEPVPEVGPDIQPGSTALRVVVTGWQPGTGWILFADESHRLTFDRVESDGWISGWISFEPRSSIDGGRAEVTVCRRRADGLGECDTRFFSTAL